jgi:hypothetical protein
MSMLLWNNALCLVPIIAYSKIKILLIKIKTKSNNVKLLTITELQKHFVIVKKDKF